MIKPKRTIRSGSHFILNSRVLSSDSDILEMWASHFENLSKPSAEPHYDAGFNSILLGAKYTRLLFFLHHPKKAQSMKLRLSDFKGTPVRHILHVKPVHYIMSCYHGNQITAGTS